MQVNARSTRVAARGGTAARTRTLLRESFRLDRARLERAGALRAGLGVALALVAGLLAGRPLDGAIAAGGAFSAGFAALSSGYRTRATAALLATAALTVSTFVGAAVSGSLLLLALVLALWGFAAGMLVSLGVAATSVGLQAVVGLLLISPFPMPLLDASGRAGLVAAGGAVQVLLVVTLWPLRRSPAERRALAASYLALARTARAVPVVRPGGLLPEAGAIDAARTALSDPQPFARSDALLAFAVLLDRAERVRIDLATLAHLRPHLAGVPERQDAVRTADEVVLAAAQVLADLGRAIALPSAQARMAALSSTGRDGAPQRWAAIDSGVAQLAELAVRAGPARRHVGASLIGELHLRCSELAGHLAAAGLGARAAAPSTSTARAPSPFGRTAVAGLRANLRPRSPVLRHAVRLAAVLPVALLLSQALGPQHRYWLPLTALVVLKPDFTSTLTRGVGRIVGTVVGAALTTAAVAVLQPPAVVLAIGVALAACIGYAVVGANYAAYGLAVTAFVVLLLSFTGLPQSGAVGERIIATVVGGLVALLASMLWPVWERVRLPEVLARLLDAQRRLAACLLRSYAAASDGPADELDGLRAAARLARVNAEASLARAHLEPSQRGLAVDIAGSVVGLARERTLALLALQAHLPDAALPALAGQAADSSRRALLELEQVLSRTLSEQSDALRGGRAPVPVRPALRAPQERLRRALDALPEQGVDDAAVLDVEVDQLITSVLTMHEGLRAGWPVGAVSPDAAARRA